MSKYATKIIELSNWFYFSMNAWPSDGTIQIEIIIMKTQIIFNIEIASVLTIDFLQKQTLWNIFSCGESDQTSSSGARPPQDVVDVSQTPATPGLKKLATDKAVLL